MERGGYKNPTPSCCYDLSFGYIKKKHDFKGDTIYEVSDDCTMNNTFFDCHDNKVRTTLPLSRYKYMNINK